MSNRVIHSLSQGSPEWLAHRAKYWNASDAPAMMGVSPYKTRSALLHEKATGVSPDVDEHTQRLFDDGHRFEALARPLAEDIVGTDLYPISASRGKMAASLDGLTMAEDVQWEHKSINDAIRAATCGADLPLYLRVQMEHQYEVSGAAKCLFQASRWDAEDNLVEEVHHWYDSDPELRKKVADGWRQFERDIAEYVPPVAAPAVVAEPVQALPAVAVQISGQISVRDNFDVFETALRDFLDNRLIRDPQTDQDFADLDLQIKVMKKAEDALDASEAMMLAQVQSIDEAKRRKDMLATLVRDNRLMASRLYESEKTRRRVERVDGARKAFAEHIAGLQREITGVRLEVVAPDFAGAIKGLKTLASIQDKLDTALAHGKIAADQQASDLRAKLEWVNDNAGEHRGLLADLQQLVVKPFDDFKLAITARIEVHKKAEADRLEAQREQIRKEEAEKLLVAQQPNQVAPSSATPQQVASLAPIAQGTPEKAELTPWVVPARATPIGAPTLRLGVINERLAPISLTAEGLATLGIKHSATDKAAKLYYESDFEAICTKLIRHIQVAAQKQAA